MDALIDHPQDVADWMQRMISEHLPLTATLISDPDNVISFQLVTLTSRNPVRHDDRLYWTRIPVNLTVQGQPNGDVTHVGIDPHRRSVLLLGRNDELLSQPIQIIRMSVQLG